MEGGLTPKALILQIMGSLVHSMTEPAQAIVEEAGTWWKDTGRQSAGYVKGKYTVDALGRRRGESKMHNCAWFRWDKYCCPVDLADDCVKAQSMAVATGGEDPAIFACWWCGGHAADHELLADEQGNEVPGTTGPGRGQGTQRVGQTSARPGTNAAAKRPVADKGMREDTQVEVVQKLAKGDAVDENLTTDDKETVENNQEGGEGDPDDSADWVPLEPAVYHQLLVQAGLRRRVTRFQGVKFNHLDLSQVQDHSAHRASALDAQVPKWLMPGHATPGLLLSSLNHANRGKPGEIAG